MPGIRREALHVEGPTVGYAMATELTKKIGVIVPFLQWPLVAIAAVLLHFFWPDNMYVLAFLGVAAIVFSVFLWFLTHDRKGLASEQAVVTVLIYGTILGCIDHMGWTRFTFFLIVFVVFLTCASWSMRNIIRHHDVVASTGFDKMFDDIAPGTKARLQASTAEPKPRKRWALNWHLPKLVTHSDRSPVADKPPEPPTEPPTGKVRKSTQGSSRKMRIKLVAGETFDNFQKKIPALESVAGVPPGTFTATQDMDNARYVDMVISDPRSIKGSLPYPGPSYIGGSIADSMSVGLYQDGSEVEFDILGLQMQIMGMVGSGKSLGACWSCLAEVITRHDAIVWAIDITKGEQTLGPLRPALHRVATTPEDAMQLLEDANALIKPRTDYLAKKGMGKWQKGCGLKYLVVWMEEIPDIIDALSVHERGELSGVDIWIKSVKAARSAGISFVWSLQRADAEQVPIITRSQAAKWCFGVSSSLDASFGLSRQQDDAGAEPEKWANRHPGKFFFDAPSIDEEKLAMAARAWYWGTDDKAIAAHAKQYPSADRPEDEVMAKVLAKRPAAVIAPENDEEDMPMAEVPDEYGTTTIPDNKYDEPENEGDMSDVTDEDLDAEPEVFEGTDFPLTRPEGHQMTPEAARTVIRSWLVKRAGNEVTNADLIEVRQSTGMGRSWGYKVLNEFETFGLVKRIDSEYGVSWRVTDNEEVLSHE